MLLTRVIPVLLLEDDNLVKPIKFKKRQYIGDPINAVRIFNELEVDELVFLDIQATLQKRGPRLNILKDLANECFMPLAYGGGISNFEQIVQIFTIGFEKVILNSILFSKSELISEATNRFGSQSIIASIDVKKNVFGKYEVWSHCGTKNTHIDPVVWAKKVVELGCGELLLTSIDNEGTWNGYDLKLIKLVTENVSVPVVANGGAGKISDIGRVIHDAEASAAALGSMVVFQKKGMGVLVNFPDKNDLDIVLKHN